MNRIFMLLNVCEGCLGVGKAVEGKKKNASLSRVRKMRKSKRCENAQWS
jgi:hypothetical protein